MAYLFVETLGGYPVEREELGIQQLFVAAQEWEAGGSVGLDDGLDLQGLEIEYRQQWFVTPSQKQRVSLIRGKSELRHALFECLFLGFRKHPELVHSLQLFTKIIQALIPGFEVLRHLDDIFTAAEHRGIHDFCARLLVLG